MARCRDSERLQIHTDGQDRQVTDHQGRTIDRWYYRDGSTLIGPLTPWAMRMELRAGEIKPDTPVLREGDSEPLPAVEWPDLFDEEDWGHQRVHSVRDHHETTWSPKVMPD